MFTPPSRRLVYNIYDGFSTYNVSYSYDTLSYKTTIFCVIIDIGTNKRRKQNHSFSESRTNLIIRKYYAALVPAQFIDN